MPADRLTAPPEALRPPPMRLPPGATPYGLAGQAFQVWRLLSQARQQAGERSETARPLESGNPSEEYRSVCEFMRLYATLRFYQLALLLGTTGSIVTALSSVAVRSAFARAELLKVGGLVVSLAFLVMELRASSHWFSLRRRANQLADVLRFEPFPASSRWSPFTTTGAGFYLHTLVTTLWLFSLFIPLAPLAGA